MLQEIDRLERELESLLPLQRAPRMSKRKITTIEEQPTKKQRTSQPARKKSKKAFLGTELKFNDVSISTDASSTPVEVALTTFATGDTALTRDGNKALIKSIELKINYANEALTQNNTARFVLVCDKQANVTQATWFAAANTDVYDSVGVTARRGVPTMSRFRILMDKTVVCNQGSGTGGALQQGYFKKFIKIPEDLQLCTWGASTAVIPTTNAFTLMYVGTTASGATDLDVVGTARIRFEG